MLWPPEQFRYAMCGWAADHVEAMNRGDATAGLLEKAMYKPLLAHVSRRCSTSRKLNLRFRMLRNGQHTALLERIEEQTWLPLSPLLAARRKEPNALGACPNVVRTEKASNHYEGKLLNCLRHSS